MIYLHGFSPIADGQTINQMHLNHFMVRATSHVTPNA